jgi:hypothetical protein
MLVGTGTQRAQLSIFLHVFCIVSVRCCFRVITLSTIWLLFTLKSRSILCKQKSNGLTRTYFRCFVALPKLVQSQILSRPPAVAFGRCRF